MIEEGEKFLSVAKQQRLSFPYPIRTFMILFFIFLLQWILFIFLNIYGINASLLKLD